MPRPRSLAQLSHDPLWQSLCSAIGADVIRGRAWQGERVQAEAGNRVMTLEVHTDPEYAAPTSSDGIEALVPRRLKEKPRKNVIRFTRMRAPCENRDGFRFAVSRTGRFSELGRILGMQDVTIGHPDFDDAFIIRGNDDSRLRALFADAGIRQRIQVQPAIHLELRDDQGWYDSTYPEGVDELYFEVAEAITDLERLQTLYVLFADVLDRLDQIGAAYHEPRLPSGALKPVCIRCGGPLLGTSDLEALRVEVDAMLAAELKRPILRAEWSGSAPDNPIGNVLSRLSSGGGRGGVWERGQRLWSQRLEEALTCLRCAGVAVAEVDAPPAPAAPSPPVAKTPAAVEPAVSPVQLTPADLPRSADVTEPSGESIPDAVAIQEASATAAVESQAMPAPVEGPPAQPLTPSAPAERAPAAPVPVSPPAEDEADAPTLSDLTPAPALTSPSAPVESPPTAAVAPGSASTPPATPAAASGARLVGLEGPAQDRQFTLVEPTSNVGRSIGCQVSIDDPTLSYQHARISLRNGRWTIQDSLGSGGTFVNDERLRGSRELQDGDVIRLGQSWLRFESN